jgi:hypothetical protein
MPPLLLMAEMNIVARLVALDPLGWGPLQRLAARTD